MTSPHRAGRACGLLPSHGLGPAVRPLGPLQAQTPSGGAASPRPLRARPPAAGSGLS